MIDRNPRGLVMDLVNSGVYDEDFELVWANKRDEDEPYPPHPDTPNTPNFGENPKPNSETIRLWDSATTTARISTVTSMRITTTTPTTSTQTYQAATDYDTYTDRFISTFSTSTSTYSPSCTSTLSTSISTIYTSTSFPTSSSKSNPKTTITSTNTGNTNATALGQNSPTFYSLPDTEGTITKQQHTSSALAVTVSVTVIVSVVALAIMAFLVRRALGRQRRRNEELRAIGEKPVTGMGAIVNGMGIRRQGNGNGGNGGDPEASWPEMKRNPSISNSETGSERALDARDEKTIRPPSTSTISSGWGDGLSIHSLEMNENEPVQGLGIRPQSRQPPTPYESNNEIVSHGHKTTYPHNPFADPPQPPTYSIPKLSPVLIPSFEIERYRNAYGVTPTGDMIHEYIQSLNANTGRTAPPSLTSELDALERQREMEGGHIGGEIPQPNGSRWSNPFTPRERRGTRAYEEMGGEERSEGKWRDAKSWVRGQVERVKN
ncbi:hypothetical protein DID88_007004 [Monilinia fructigena]|uniref:Uncharacterized protein n=1 Tax=Monilinia fructigena TaxID=38457 RepID=A0A395IGK1_9HELO|nr:hypothetical protein DID88_007004 [Monilinia fructigena]